jgi:putative ABC transport system permease protein
MSWLRTGQAQWWGVVRHAQINREIEEELRFHLKMRTQENIARGVEPVEASLRARRRFGNFNSIKDACRDVRGAGALQSFGQDLRFAARMLLKHRVFSMVAVMALGLSVGANIAIYTVASRVLLHPLPYPDPARIMSVTVQDPALPATHYSLSYPDFVDHRSRNEEFESLGAYCRRRFTVTNVGERAVQVDGSVVAGDFFSVLGVKPELGRVFMSEEDEPGNRVAVISYDFWQKHYLGRPEVLSETLSLAGENYQIVGVMPASFRFPLESYTTQIWTTIAREREPSPDGGAPYTSHRDGHFLTVLGRLKPNVSPAAADASLAARARDLYRLYPETNRRFSLRAVTPWLAHMTKQVRPALITLVVGALCLLGVTCANIANLLLARGASRQKEVAIRSALGAGHGRILRQLLTESLLLATIGGAVGLLVAVAGTYYIVSVLPPSFPRLAEISPDIGTLLFAGIVTLLTSCLFGLAPAWRSARCELASIINDCSRGSTETRRGHRLRSALVIAEMVLAFVLLSGACLLIRSLHELQSVPPGFDPHHLLTAKLTLPDTRDTEARPRAVVFYEELMRRTAELPGVQSASATSSLPLNGPQALVQIYVTGRSMDESNLPVAQPRVVMPKFFQTMGIPIKTGRDFDERDNRDAPGVVIVSENFARMFFGNENPIGRRITPTMSDNSAPFIEREIIGIVGDIKASGLNTEDRPQLYLPHPQCTALEMTVVLRSMSPPDELFQALQDVLSELNKDVPFAQRRTMKQYLIASVAQPRLNSTLLSVFAIVAVVLTAVGVYGVMAYSVTQRQHEIGIRIALGAQKLAIFRLLMRNGIHLVGWSIAIGWVCTLVATRFLRGFGYELPGHEGAILILVTALLSIIALAACWLPAKRASEVDPLVALGQR